MYTIPMINVGIAAIIATEKRRRSFLCSFLYICRATSSEEGGCHIEMGDEVVVEIVDNIVRIVK